MDGKKFLKIRETPAFCGRAARWFAQKWGIPEEAYKASMQACQAQPTGVPQWYLAVSDEGKILAGAGVIENDFHERRDLRPNLCGLYVEKGYRNQGLAKELLYFVRGDMAAMGVKKLYLITDHMRFYERCGWEFLTLVKEEGGARARMYMAHTP